VKPLRVTGTVEFDSTLIGSPVSRFPSHPRPFGNCQAGARLFTKGSFRHSEISWLSGVTSENEEKIPVEHLPHCKQPGCGGLLRPAVVWFGEAIDLLDPIEVVVQQADMCLVVGTSSTASIVFSWAYWKVLLLMNHRS